MAKKLVRKALEMLRKLATDGTTDDSDKDGEEKKDKKVKKDDAKKGNDLHFTIIGTLFLWTHPITVPFPDAVTIIIPVLTP